MTLSFYDHDRDIWVGPCPYGTECSGCDARGYCEMGRKTMGATEEALEAMFGQIAREHSKSDLVDLPSLPWTWNGGYPQRITGPDGTVIAEVFENPDLPAVIAPTICKAVNAYFGRDGEKTYPERIES